MTINDKKKRLVEKLKDKSYRDSFVASHIFNGIAFQIKSMREHKPLTQKELGDLAGMKQERISVLENPNNSNVTIDTLRRIASAFDIALMIRFVPFSDLVKWDINLSPEVLTAKSFEEDLYFREVSNGEISLGLTIEKYQTDQNVVYLPLALPTRKKAHNINYDIESSPKRSSQTLMQKVSQGG